MKLNAGWVVFALIEEGAARLFFDCASQQFLPEPGSGRWSRNHDGKPAKSAAASD
ncbi:hypothetical protein ACF1BQ_045125 [Bradyrhizobium sp. RDT10]